MTDRVKIPPYCSAYRSGERTGTVLKIGKLNDLGADRKGSIQIVRVKLDNSGKTILVDLGDCELLQAN